MKKIFVSTTILLFLILCSLPSLAQNNKHKVLVSYFTVPATVGVDASSGASRVVAEGKLYGATEYLAMEIASVPGGELFPITTNFESPGHHTQLID